MTLSVIENHYKTHPSITGRESAIPLVLYDAKGQPFAAKQDGYLAVLDCVIEFKSHALNSKGSIQACYNKLKAQAAYRGLLPSGDYDHNTLSSILWRNGYRMDCLQNAWNHSLAKHLIVSKALRDELHANYLIVFDNLSPLTNKKPSKVFYQSKGLTVLSKREFDLLLKDAQAGMSKADICKKYALPFI